MIIYVQYLLYKLHLMTFNYSTTMGDRRTMELLETFSEQYSSIYIVLQYQSKWTIKISIVANALGNYLSSNWKFLFGYIVPHLQSSFGMVKCSNMMMHFWHVENWLHFCESPLLKIFHYLNFPFFCPLNFLCHQCNIPRITGGNQNHFLMMMTMPANIEKMLLGESFNKAHNHI